MSYLKNLLGESYKEGMTEDELSSALETLNIKANNNTSEIDKLRSQLSKANTEAASYKKQLRDKQTEDEAKAQEEKEALDKIMQENAELKRTVNVNSRLAQLVGMGYEEALAKETAEAMVDGNLDIVLANQTKFLEQERKNIRVDNMKNTPRPVGGSLGDGKQMSKEEFDKLGYKEKLNVKQSQPDLYKEFTK